MEQTEAARQEQARVEAVHALRLLEQPVAAGVAQVVALTAELCHTENATINIVDEEWLHSIATVGGPGGRFPREDIPCDLVVRTGQELVVPNAAQVPVLAASPVVDGTLASIGCYASVPLRTLSGHVVGTLCAWDEHEQAFTESQLKMLRLLADHAIGIFQMSDAVERARRATERLVEQSGTRLAAEALLTAAFEHASDGIAVLSATGSNVQRVIRANPAVNALTGRTGLVGLTLAEVLGGSDRPQSNRTRDDDAMNRRALLEDIDLLIAEPAGTFRNDSLEHLTRMPVGTGHIYLHLVVTLTRDSAGRPEHALVQMRDVTTQQAHEQWLIRQTQTDPLTGLGNRLAMRERLSEEISALRAGRTGLGVLMIDLDNFKSVNDRLGHPAGDDLLCRMATALVSALPVEAFATRLGGDEFVVLTPSDSAAELQELAEHVSQALTETATYFSERLGVLVGASIGLTFTQNPATDPEELLKAADAAMYENKRRRRHTVPGMSPEVDDEARRPLRAVPSPRDGESIIYPTPTPAPRHNPGPGETPHPAHTRSIPDWR